MVCYIWEEKGARLVISRNEIHSNNATRGGLAAILESSLEITMSSIVNNTAETGEVISACSSDISVSDQLNTTINPDNPMCTPYSGNINEIDCEVITTTTTEALVDTTTAIDILVDPLLIMR